MPRKGPLAPICPNGSCQFLSIHAEPSQAAPPTGMAGPRPDPALMLLQVAGEFVAAQGNGTGGI